MSRFTTARDLGTEGAADADVGLQQAIDQGLIPGPRLLVTTRAIVATAKGSGLPVVVHASTAEGMRRAVMAGAESMEHGDDGTPEVFKLMAERGVFFGPTLAAGDAVLQYRGWKKGGEARQLPCGARRRGAHVRGR